MPDWLPDTVCVNGEWNDVVARLYNVFDRDFRQIECSFEGVPVWWDRRKLGGSPYEEGFWHLITRVDKASGDRLLDPRRAERLPWCKPTIEHSREPEVRVWDYREAPGMIRTYLWLEHWDYVIVIEKRQLRGGPKVAFLITAFYVEGKSTKRRLQSKYERRVR